MRTSGAIVTKKLQRPQGKMKIWSLPLPEIKKKIKIKRKSHLMKVLSYFYLYICSYCSSHLEFSSYSSCITPNKVHVTSLWEVLPRITSKGLSSLSLHCCPLYNLACWNHPPVKHEYFENKWAYQCHNNYDLHHSVTLTTLIEGSVDT